MPLGKGLIPEPESIYIFSKQSIVPAVMWIIIIIIIIITIIIITFLSLMRFTL